MDHGGFRAFKVLCALAIAAVCSLGSSPVSQWPSSLRLAEVGEARRTGRAAEARAAAAEQPSRPAKKQPSQTLPRPPRKRKPPSRRPAKPPRRPTEAEAARKAAAQAVPLPAPDSDARAHSARPECRCSARGDGATRRRRRGRDRGRLLSGRSRHDAAAFQGPGTARGKAVWRGRAVAGRDPRGTGGFLLSAQEGRADPPQFEGRSPTPDRPDAGRGPSFVRTAIRRGSPEDARRRRRSRPTPPDWPKSRGDSFTPRPAMRPRTCWACINWIIRSRWPPRCASRGFKPRPPPAQFEPMLSVQIATCWARAGMSDKAAQTLAALRERSPDARVVVAGQEKELFRDSKDALAWLTRTVGPQQQLRAWAPSNGRCSAAAPVATRSAPAAVRCSTAAGECRYRTTTDRSRRCSSSCSKPRSIRGATCCPRCTRWR